MILSNIEEKEIEIAYELAQRVLELELFLIEASDICGEVDRFDRQVDHI